MTKDKLEQFYGDLESKLNLEVIVYMEDKLKLDVKETVDNFI